MGLAFWGGFASGMSESIERNRDRLERQQEIQAEQTQMIAKEQARAEENVYKLSEDTRKAFSDIDSKIVDIKSGKTKLTEDEAIREVNRLQAEKVDIYKSASDRAVELGKTIDVNPQGIETLATVTVDGEKYVINHELARSIQDSNGQLKLQGNEIMNRVMEQNSQGVFVPAKNSDGSFKYESTGEFLQPFNNVFKGTVASDRKGTTTGLAGEMSPEEQQYWENRNIDPNTVSASVLDAGRKEMLKDALKTDGNIRKEEVGVSFIDSRLDPKGANPITWGTEVTGQDIVEARAAQPKEAKMSATQKTELSGKLAIYQDGAEIIKYISDNNVNFDLGETGKTEISKLTGMSWEEVKGILAKDSKELTEDEAKIKAKANTAMISKITSDTKLRNLVANYVKIISGAAVTDQERKTFYDIITAGQYADEKAMLTAMTSFVESIGENYKNTYGSLKYSYPADYTTAVKAWNDADRTKEIEKYRRKTIDDVNTESTATEIPSSELTGKKSWKNWDK